MANGYSNNHPPVLKNPPGWTSPAVNFKKVTGVKNDGTRELHHTLADTMSSALGAAQIPHKGLVNGRPSSCADAFSDLVSWNKPADDKDQRSL
jgi:hypothetical protein